MTSRRRIVPIIVHVGSAAVAAIIIVLACLHQLFRSSDGSLLTWSEFLAPKNLATVLSYRNDPYIDCPIADDEEIALPQSAATLPGVAVIAPLAHEDAVLVAAKSNDEWAIYKASEEELTPVVQNIMFSGNSLTKSYLPISSLVVYPDCRKGTCTLEQFNLGNRDTHSLPAIGDSENVAVEGVDNLFYDESKELIAYTTQNTDISNRVVVNFKGKLIQSIDESPGINRQLHLRTYQPESGMMIYEDEATKDRMYYAIDHIELHRNYCRP